MRYRLEELFDLQMGKTPARANLDYWNGTNKWVSISDLSGYDKYVTDTKECISDLGVSESGIKVVPKNTVIMSFKLSIGKIAITTEDVYTNEAIMAFIDKGVCEINTDYLYYLFSGTDWNKGTNKAVLGLTLNKATLSKKEIDIPDLHTQNEVVKKLDALSNVIQLQKLSLDKLDELIESRFNETFGDMITNPMDWNRDKLGRVCDVRDGTHDSPSYYDEGYPLVTSKNVTNGTINFSNCNCICEADFNKINERSKVNIGDILMPMIGTIGKPVIVKTDKPFAIKNVALIKFYPNSLVNNTYIHTILKSDYFDRMVISKIRGGTQKFIALGDIRELTISIPPIDIQNQFADFVTQVEKQKATVQQSIDKLKTLKKSLMQEYFG